MWALRSIKQPWIYRPSGKAIGGVQMQDVHLGGGHYVHCVLDHRYRPYKMHHFKYKIPRFWYKMSVFNPNSSFDSQNRRPLSIMRPRQLYGRWGIGNMDGGGPEAEATAGILE